MDIFVSLSAQMLELYDGIRACARYQVSSSARGAGETHGSLKTPRGRHLVRAKIGAGCPENTVFVARRPSGEIWTPELSAAFPGRDWILTRILWLSGCEPGCNRMGSVDTMRRYIYLHGTPDTAPMGEPGSHGCLRMRNADIIPLFARVPAYTIVNIGDFHVADGGLLESRAMAASGELIGQCRADGTGLITSLEVSEAWRRKGVARQLLRKLAELSRDSGTIRLRIDSPGVLEGFWRSLDFQPTSGPGATFELAIRSSIRG